MEADREQQTMTYLGSFETWLNSAQPLVVMGMHRSGTTLLVRLLMSMGIYMGRKLLENVESIYFQRLNRGIFSNAGARWSVVDPLLQAMRTQEFVTKQAEEIKRTLSIPRLPLRRGVGIAEYFGYDPINISRPVPHRWGWKDPRSTITFPVWLRVFPRARFIHIIRNGIDVAISINRRAVQRSQDWKRKLFPKDYSPAALDLEYCFRLWEDYVSFALDHRYLIPEDQYFELRYEALLESPVHQLRAVLEFIGYPFEVECLRQACEIVNPARLDNSAYAVPYRDQIPKLVDSLVMKRLGYAYHVL